MARIARVTAVQAIFSAHDDIIANIVDFVIISLSWLDVKVLEFEVPARLSFGAVEPDDTVVCCRASDVFD